MSERGDSSSLHDGGNYGVDTFQGCPGRVSRANGSNPPRYYHITRHGPLSSADSGF